MVKKKRKSTDALTKQEQATLDLTLKLLIALIDVATIIISRLLDK